MFCKAYATLPDFHFSKEILLFIPCFGKSIYTIAKCAKNVKSLFKFLVEVLLEKMADFDNSVTNFEADVNTKLEDLEAKHKAELAELCRLQKSYKRYLKRRYPDINQGKEEAGNRNPVHAIGGNRVGHSET